MTTVRSNIYFLIAQKSAREQRRITLRTVADETGISYYTLSAIAKETIREYPRDVLAQLCVYFQCSVGDLLTLADVPMPPPHLRRSMDETAQRRRNDRP